MKPSAGTASVLGLNKIKMEAPPTCAYIMLGGGCRNSCLFCAQRNRGDGDSGRGEKKFLSRVNWQGESDEKVLNAISGKFETGEIKRVCFQVTDSDGIYDEVLRAVKKTRELCVVPVCVSITGISMEQIDDLIKAGAEKIAFSFDAATPELYAKIKGRKWEDEWRLYEETVKKHPGVPVIHLIAGLGETGEEMAGAIKLFYDKGSHVSLFAFTPLPGTPLEREKQPGIESYRKLQTVLYIIRKRKEIEERKKSSDQVNSLKIIGIKNENPEKSEGFTGRADEIEISDEKIWESCDMFWFESGKIIMNPAYRKFLIQNMPSEAYQTFGCPDCNRPFYNEKPNQTPYNYPRPLSEEERVEAVNAAVGF
jgi:biotin synthase